MNCAIFGLFISTFLTSGLHYAAASDEDKPSQIHLSYGESLLDFVVTWTTFGAGNDATVRFGKNKLDQLTIGKTTLFRSGNIDRYIHRVTLKDLSPNTKYIYSCGGDKGWSQTFSFQTNQLTNDWSPRLAIFGDLGVVDSMSLPYIKKDVDEGKIDAILHVGDFAYDMNNNHGKVGDQFMEMIEPIAAQIPYMTVPGNHEEHNNFSDYRARFSMPGGTESLFYSFDMGPVHFIGISSEVYYQVQYGLKLIVNQFMWLEEDLKEAVKNRKERPWIITYGHRPMYCSDDDGDDCNNHGTVIRSGLPILKIFGLEDLFCMYGVDLEIWAHEHSYERSWPLYDYNVYNGSLEYPYTNPKAPVHFTSGSAGCKEHTDNFKKYQPNWSAFRDSRYGYTRMTVYNSSHLYYEQLGLNQTIEAIDKVWLIKDTHEPYQVCAGN